MSMFFRSALMIIFVLGLMSSADGADLSWIDADDLVVEGRAFDERAKTFDRLPGRAEGVVRDPVWNLSRHSAGMLIRFQTDAPDIHVRWTLSNDQLGMPHMPATGVSGVDLYARADHGRWRWVGNGRPTAVENSARLMSGSAPAKGDSREYLLYLPLYNGTEKLEIGVPEGYEVVMPPDRPEDRRKPVVFYGTSITHGGCASRPGMTHVAILGRRFDRPVVNLGFSGNGTLDLEIADFLAEIDAEVYVLDCLPNLNGQKVRERAVPFVKKLRALRPDVPIVLVEDRTYAGSEFHAGRRKRNEENRAALQAAYQALIADGFTDIEYVDGDSLLGEDGEGTVDGSHPTDLGFMRQADALQPAIDTSIRN